MTLYHIIIYTSVTLYHIIIYTSVTLYHIIIYTLYHIIIYTSVTLYHIIIYTSVTIVNDNSDRGVKSEDNGGELQTAKRIRLSGDATGPLEDYSGRGGTIAKVCIYDIMQSVA